MFQNCDYFVASLENKYYFRYSKKVKSLNNIIKLLIKYLLHTKDSLNLMRKLSLRNVNKLSFFTPFSIYNLQKKNVDLCMDVLIDGHMHGHLNRWTYAWTS